MSLLVMTAGHQASHTPLAECQCSKKGASFLSSRHSAARNIPQKTFSYSLIHTAHTAGLPSTVQAWPWAPAMQQRTGQSWSRPCGT